jgi:hypothetical protein
MGVSDLMLRMVQVFADHHVPVVDLEDLDIGAVELGQRR